jgi:CBS domain-containing protein
MTPRARKVSTLRVKDLMTQAPATCGTSTNMQAVMRAMFEYECGALLVVDDKGRLAGLLTQRDVCRAMLSHGIALRQLAVKDIIGAQVFSCSPNDAVESAVDLMHDLNLRSLPVTDMVGHPVGLLSIDEVPSEPDHSPLSHYDPEAMRTFATICDSHPH